jgi:hypothetical protein
MPRRLLLALTAAAVIGALAKPPTLHLSFADAADLNPRRMEISASLLGLGAAFVLSWTQRPE